MAFPGTQISVKPIVVVLGDGQQGIVGKMGREGKNKGRCFYRESWNPKLAVKVSYVVIDERF
jgi:hypothetical protein